MAINIPLALLFAFSVLFLRGKSANLLSIGAVDFGIIVDSSVIMVENIYRHLSSGEYAELPLEGTHHPRLSRSRTAVVFLDDDHGFRLHSAVHHARTGRANLRADGRYLCVRPGGGLLLALTVAPVMCFFFFKNLKPAPDNWMVRWLKSRYLRQLRNLPESPRGDAASLRRC